MVSPLLLEIGTGVIALAVFSWFLVGWLVAAALGIAGIAIVLGGFATGRRDDR